MNRLITILLLAVGSLVALSVVMLASATMLRPSDTLLHTWVLRQAIFCGIGFVALGVMASLDYHLLQRFAWFLYGGALLLLLLTLTPLGTITKGAQRWLFGVQPSEMAKLGLIVGLAWYGARFPHRMGRFFSGMLMLAVIALPPLLLILAEPDKGTAALLGLVTFFLMLVAGVRWWHVTVPALVCAAGFVALVMHSDYAMKRVNAFLHPTQNKDDYQQVQESLYAFGEGRLTGAGLGGGAYKFNIPEQHTDFIFPVVGEELGLGFTLGVVGVFVVILVCGALVTHAAPDAFGTLLAAGITFVISAQAAVNLGVVTDLLPNKGMPLPFVSRGGTGMVLMLALVGLLVSVARQAVGGGAARRAAGNPFDALDTDLPG